MHLLLTSRRTRSATKPTEDRSSKNADAGGPRSTGYLFSPAIDLFFVANAFWPLLLLVDRFGGITTHQSLLFWQIYFVTAPHRWITLVLVSIDHHKGHDRRLQFFALGSAILIACVCAKLGTGSLLCLGAIDYIWNAWHFASQHHGIFRLYQRQQVSPPDGETAVSTLPLDESEPNRASPREPIPQNASLKGASSPTPWATTVERILFRGFLLYVIARVAGWGWSEGPFDGFQWVASIDWVMLAIPAGLVTRELFRYAFSDRVAFAGGAYLLSVMTLFISLLLASHYESRQWVVQLALASAVFHSLEYMSIVTWSMNKSKSKTGSNVLTRLTQAWLLFLLIFVVVIGMGNYLLSRGYFEFWVFINIVIAFWHYGFDGMIWKSRKPGTAAPTSAVTTT